MVKHHPPQFKADAVALYASRPGATTVFGRRGPGINTEALRAWRRGREAIPRTATPTPAPTEQPSFEAENDALRRILWPKPHDPWPTSRVKAPALSVSMDVVHIIKELG
ncbi:MULTISPECIES: transposase [Streptomyces]|uniref:transposase n=1 Tax=Streptomyces lycopersici TaxID=2974589 RepID=UPI0035233751